MSVTVQYPSIKMSGSCAPAALGELLCLPTPNYHFPNSNWFFLLFTPYCYLNGQWNKMRCGLPFLPLFCQIFIPMPPYSFCSLCSLPLCFPILIRKLRVCFVVVFTANYKAFGFAIIMQRTGIPRL